MIIIDSLIIFNISIVLSIAEHLTPPTTPLLSHIYPIISFGAKKSSFQMASAIRGSIRSEMRPRRRSRTKSLPNETPVGRTTPRRQRRRFGTDKSLRSGFPRRRALRVWFVGSPELIGAVLQTLPDDHRKYTHRPTISNCMVIPIMATIYMFSTF